MPDSLYKKLDADVALFGDFEVCPLTKEEPEVMQMICIELASHLIVKHYQEAKTSR
jgi:hypothetical protein